MIMFKRAVSAVSMALALQCLGGCAVAPWERGTLAKPQMALEPNPLQTELRGHAYGAREAATGSSSGSGGGCGCY
ncbi:DUF4266 domain-containing protein [Methylomonas rivi]|uniref:DUF4266 domain-containing protein n=1 Tax=Methylomonas rivi TaxID=2952226 RepID=A0ABT1U8L7_9GAMM|nr:DUF4266 domain-containing protein [Methylomonas sp. WSC-6]MCQ8130185.1 DUF4266 domain-containing protein [Methylomonas sp. WSC-6]